MHLKNTITSRTRISNTENLNWYVRSDIWVPSYRMIRFLKVIISFSQKNKCLHKWHDLPLAIPFRIIWVNSLVILLLGLQLKELTSLFPCSKPHYVNQFSSPSSSLSFRPYSPQERKKEWTKETAEKRETKSKEERKKSKEIKRMRDKNLKSIGVSDGMGGQGR